MTKYQKMAKSILCALGGKKNILQVSHCITRLRFILRGQSIPDKEKMLSIPGVLSVVQQGGQLQVVIGSEVNLVYKQLNRMLGDEPECEENVSAVANGFFDRITSTISGIFTPLIGVLMTAGLIKSMLALLTATQLLKEHSDNFIILNAIANSFFFFFPVFIGATSAKVFRVNQFLGMLIGSIMVYPDIINLAHTGADFRFLNVSMELIDYSASVFPVIASVWLASLLTHLLEKYIFKALQLFLIPCVVILLIVPLTLFIVGPITTSVSVAIAAISLEVYSFNPALAGLLIGGPWILIVMFGLHWAFIPVFINNITTIGYDSIMGLLAANQFAIAAAAIALGCRERDKINKRVGFTSGVSALIGVSEPAIYGLLVPKKRPLITAIIGGSLGGCIGGFALTKNYAFAPAGLFGITGTINPTGLDMGFYGGLVEIIIGFIVAFVLTYFFGVKNPVQTREI